MALKEILDRIKSKLPADAGEEINTLLADARREADTVLDDLRSANSESKSRKDKLRDQQNEIDTLKSDLEKFKVSSDSPEFKAMQKKASEYDALLEKQNAEAITEWTERAKVFALPETDPKRKKADAIKADFQFPEQMTPEVAKENLKAFKLAEKTGYFETPESRGTDYGHGSGGNPSPDQFKFFTEK